MILIAGSSGIIGTFLCSELVKKGYVVFGVSNETKQTESHYTVDLTNIDSNIAFVKRITKPDVLIFLVALAHEKGAKKQFDVFKKINLTTLENLLTSLEEYNKLPEKIIFTSTISVYGERHGTDVFTEVSELVPKSPYAVTKKLAEEFLLNHFRDRVFILRLAPVYSDKFLLNINRRIKMLGRYFRIGTGNQKLTLLNINNIFYVIESIINDKVPVGIYNIGDEKVYDFNGLLTRFGNPNFLQIPKWIMKLVYYFALITQNYRVKENALKLLKNNIYETNKLKQFVSLPFTLQDLGK